MDKNYYLQMARDSARIVLASDPMLREKAGREELGNDGNELGKPY